MKPLALAVAVMGVVGLTAVIAIGGSRLGGATGSEAQIEVEDIPLDMLDGDGAEEAQPDMAEPGSEIGTPADGDTSGSIQPTEPAADAATIPTPAASTQLHTSVVQAAPDAANAQAQEPAQPVHRAPVVTPQLVMPEPLAAQTSSIVESPVPTARTVSPSVIAPPAIDANELQRIEPRQPLSEIALATPPKPPAPEDWKPTVLHRPVAIQSAMFEAMGYTVAIAGAEGITADATCDYEGRSWNCGMRARTAFRSFLRGRAPSCKVPPEADKQAIVARCSLGKQDVGMWLVENGWANAAAGGPYAEVSEKAKSGKKGIFGPPPSALHTSGTSTTLTGADAPADIVMPIDPMAESQDDPPAPSE